MNKSQVAKLDTILAKLESLQIEVRDVRVKERLNAAKRELLRAIPSFLET